MEAISLEMKPVVYPRATWDTFQSKLKKQKKLKKKSSLKILFLSFQKQVFLIYQELKLSSSKICYVFQKKKFLYFRRTLSKPKKQKKFNVKKVLLTILDDC